MRLWVHRSVGLWMLMFRKMWAESPPPAPHGCQCKGKNQSDSPISVSPFLSCIY